MRTWTKQFPPGVQQGMDVLRGDRSRRRPCLKGALSAMVTLRAKPSKVGRRKCPRKDPAVLKERVVNLADSVAAVAVADVQGSSANGEASAEIVEANASNAIAT
jgi:hypothetical protein